MREPKVILKDIAALKKELNAAHKEKTSELGIKAIKKLKALGYKWDSGNAEWVKVIVKPVDIKPHKSAPRAGELAQWDGGLVGGVVYVRTVGSYWCTVSKAKCVMGQGAIIENNTRHVRTSELQYFPRSHFIG